MVYGNYGSDEYGVSPYGGAYPPFGLESVTPLTPTLIRVRYTALFDQSFVPLVNLANYSIFPALTIHSIVIETAQTVLITTDPQEDTLYTLTIQQAQGYFGQPLDPDLDSATFNGLPALPSLGVVATRENRVRVIFTEPMLENAALTSPGQYNLADLSGNPIPILSVTIEQDAPPIRSVVLHTGTDLTDEHHYRVTVLGGVVTEDFDPLTPNTGIFQWVDNPLRTQIPLDRFSGEVLYGLYGIHGGLVFFSPALETAAANSTIQVDQVDVCTRAYDEYKPPQPIDPKVLYTHGVNVTPTPATTTLNNAGIVLWTGFPRLVDAKLELSDLQEDTFPAPVDGPCDAILQEGLDPDYVSLLNNTNWKLFDNAGEPPVYFKTADNLAPIPGGTTTVINLQP
jgi:hypothetical protein